MIEFAVPSKASFACSRYTPLKKGLRGKCSREKESFACLWVRESRHVMSHSCRRASVREMVHKGVGVLTVEENWDGSGCVSRWGGKT